MHVPWIRFVSRPAALSFMLFGRVMFLNLSTARRVRQAGFVPLPLCNLILGDDYVSCTRPVLTSLQRRSLSRAFSMPAKPPAALRGAGTLVAWQYRGHVGAPCASSALDRLQPGQSCRTDTACSAKPRCGRGLAGVDVSLRALVVLLSISPPVLVTPETAWCIAGWGMDRARFCGMIGGRTGI